MKSVTIREMRSALSHLDEILATAGELVVTRRGRPLARVLPVRPARRLPSHADLRQSMRKLRTPSERLLRQDRDKR